jgi:modulator of FtsH protease
MQSWETFFAAQIGASATLAGLIFVGISLNLQKILAAAQLTSRAMQALIALMTILVIATLLLVPQQPFQFAALEVLLAGIVSWGSLVFTDLRTWQKVDPQYRSYFVQNVVINQLSVLPFIIAGIVMFTSGLSGVYWTVPGVIFSFVNAIVNSWVLLIEINR